MADIIEYFFKLEAEAHFSTWIRRLLCRWLGNIPQLADLLPQCLDRILAGRGQAIFFKTGRSQAEQINPAPVDAGANAGQTEGTKVRPYCEDLRLAVIIQFGDQGGIVTFQLA